MMMTSSHPDLRALRPRRVCLIKPSSLGDVVCALPVLGALRDRWPEARIAWVVNQGWRGLLDGHPALDEVIAFDRKRAGLQPSGIATTVRFLTALRHRGFDLAIDLQGLMRSGIMAAATGAPVRVGLADAREGAPCFYTHHVYAPAEELHAVDRLMRLASAFGADVAEPRFVVATAAEDRQWARRALSAVPRPRLAVILGARWLTKRWPPSHFAEIARRAAAAFGAGLVLLGAAEDRPLVATFQDHGPNLSHLDLCGRTTLPRLSAVLAETDVVLANDTGPLHLAVATGARVVGVYTCTSPERTGPYGPRGVAVSSRVWCAASRLKQCDRLECMSELTPDRVWPAVASHLAEALRINPTAA